MLNIKKMIFFLVVGVFLIGLSNVVFASVPNNIGFDANLTGISKTATTIVGAISEFYKANGTTKNSLSETNNNMFGAPSVAYLRNTTAGVTNGWLINITIFNSNISNNFYNITRINISLPASLIAKGNGTGTLCAAESSSVSGVNCTIYNSGRDVVWLKNDGKPILINGTVGEPAGNGTTGNITLTINVTSLPSVDGKVDIRVRVSNDSAGSFASVGGATSETEFNISDKIYLDGTIPTFNSAKTNDTTHLNTTFSENINATTVKTSAFNVTYLSKAGTTIGVGVTAVATADLAQNDTQFTLTINRIEANETPTVILNMSGVTTITDLAGYSIAANTSVTATDGTLPTLLRVTLDLNYTSGGNLTLIFDEPLAISNITAITTAGQLVIADNVKITMSGGLNITNPTAIQFADGDNTTTLFLGMTDAANISRWRANKVDARILNLTIANASLFKDARGNIIRQSEVLGALSFNISTVVNDTIKPKLYNFTYNHSTRQLIVGFDEPADIPTMILQASLVLLNATTGKGVDTQDAIYIDQDFRQVNETSFVKSVVLNLSDNDRDKIAEWNRIGITTLYLTTNNRTDAFTDMAGNYMYLITNSTTTVSAFGEQSVMSHTTWTKDTTAPTILALTISDVNVTGPGNHRITVQFSENMTNTTTVALSKTISGSASTLSTYNYSFPYDTSVTIFYYNFTAADTNGNWIVNVTTAVDMSGNSMAGRTGDLNFTYDSVPPYIIYAYYLENGTTDSQYNGTLAIGDTLFLIFNEPLQTWSGNLSVGNFTFRDATAIGNAQVVSNIDGKKLTITASGSAPTLNLRGEWVDIGVNGTLLQLDQSISNTTRDLNKNSSSWFIRDKADNFAVNKSYTTSSTSAVTGPKAVIADYAFTAPNNSAVSTSFPVCVNTGNMSGYLPASSRYTFTSYYNTATWTDTAVTALAPLVGYRFTWSDTGRYPSQDASDDVFRVYLKNQSDCALESNEVTVDAGWNFLALNGNYYSSTKNVDGRMSEEVDAWLFDFNSAGTEASITVGSIVKGFGNTTIYKNVVSGGSKDWDNLIVKPYEGWWVDSTITSSTKPFTGVARW